MLTTLLLLSLRVASALTAPCPTVEWPALQPPGLYEYGVPLPSRTCSATVGVAALEYSLGIDAAVPPESEERADLAIYLEDEL